LFWGLTCDFAEVFEEKNKGQYFLVVFGFACTLAFGGEVAPFGAVFPPA